MGALPCSRAPARPLQARLASQRRCTNRENPLPCPLGPVRTPSVLTFRPAPSVPLPPMGMLNCLLRLSVVSCPSSFVLRPSSFVLRPSSFVLRVSRFQTSSYHYSKK